MVQPAGGTPAEIITGDVVHVRGGLSPEFLTGAYVKSVVEANGTVTVEAQAADGTAAAQLMFSLGGAGLSEEQSILLEQIGHLLADSSTTRLRTFAAIDAVTTIGLTFSINDFNATQLEAASYVTTVNVSTTRDRYVALRVNTSNYIGDFQVVMTLADNTRVVVPGSFFRHYHNDPTLPFRYYVLEMNWVENATISIEQASPTGASTHYRGGTDAGSAATNVSEFGRLVPSTATTVQAALVALNNLRTLAVVDTVGDLPDAETNTDIGYVVRHEQSLYVAVGDTHIIANARGDWSTIPQRDDITTYAFLPDPPPPVGRFGYDIYADQFFQVVDIGGGASRWAQVTPATALASSRSSQSNAVVWLGFLSDDNEALERIPQIAANTDYFYVQNYGSELFQRLDLGSYTAATYGTDHYQWIKVGASIRANVGEPNANTEMLRHLEVEGRLFSLPWRDAWESDGNYPQGSIVVHGGELHIRFTDTGGPGAEPGPGEADWVFIQESAYKGRFIAGVYATGTMVRDDDFRIYLRTGSAVHTSALTDAGWTRLNFPVEANPSTTTERLQTLGIGGTNYDLDVRGSAIGLRDTSRHGYENTADSTEAFATMGGTIIAGANGAIIRQVGVRIQAHTSRQYRMVLQRVTQNGLDATFGNVVYETPAGEEYAPGAGIQTFEVELPSPVTLAALEHLAIYVIRSNGGTTDTVQMRRGDRTAISLNYSDIPTFSKDLSPGSYMEIASITTQAAGAMTVLDSTYQAHMDIIYDIPLLGGDLDAALAVEANPEAAASQPVMETIRVGEEVFRSGTPVVANPQTDSTDPALSSLTIGSTDYRLEGSGSGGEGSFDDALLRPYVDHDGTNNQIAYAILTNGGSGYTEAPTVVFTGGGGTGAAAIAVIDEDSGEVVAVQVTNMGDGYTGVPAITFSGGGGGSGATATAARRGVPNDVAYVPLTLSRRPRRGTRIDIIARANYSPVDEDTPITLVGNTVSITVNGTVVFSGTQSVPSAQRRTGLVLTVDGTDYLAVGEGNGMRIMNPPNSAITTQPYTARMAPQYAYSLTEEIEVDDFLDLPPVGPFAVDGLTTAIVGDGLRTMRLRISRAENRRDQFGHTGLYVARQDDYTILVSSPHFNDQFYPGSNNGITKFALAVREVHPTSAPAPQQGGTSIARTAAIETSLSLGINAVPDVDWRTNIGVFSYITHDPVPKQSILTAHISCRLGIHGIVPLSLDRQQVLDVGFVTGWSGWTYSKQAPAIGFLGASLPTEPVEAPITEVSTEVLSERHEQGHASIAIFLVESSDGLDIEGFIAIAWGPVGDSPQVRSFDYLTAA